MVFTRASNVTMLGGSIIILSLLNHLVGQREQLRRNVEAERLGFRTRQARNDASSRTVDTIHDALRSTELVFSRDVRERLHRASAAIFRLNTPAARGTTHYKQDIIGLRNELQTLLTQMRQEGTL